MDKVVVLLSGGIDSTTCLALAVDRYGSDAVSALNVFYGQKHDKEIESAVAVAEYYGVPYFELDLSNVLAMSNCSLLAHSKEEVQKGAYADQIKGANGKPVSTYVPFRNGLFLSAAASYGLSIGAGLIMYGAHADDAAGSAYPDCSARFVEYMNAAVIEGTGKQIKVEAPFVNINKAEVVAIGLQLGAPYELTWSCYEGGEKPCGKCGTCIDRARAFAANNRRDPAL